MALQKSIKTPEQSIRQVSSFSDMSTTRSPVATLLDSPEYMEPDPGLVPLTQSFSLARRLMRSRAYHSHLSPPVRRRKRERIPADKKDATYWIKRRRNNEAARRSREKRKLNDLMLEGHLLTLSTENAQLRAQVFNLRYHSGLSVDRGQVPFTKADETPIAVRPPNLSIFPMHAYSPAPLQAGFWGNSFQEPRLERMVPRFNAARRVGVFDPTLPGPSGPGAISNPEGALGGRRSTEAEIDAQRQVSSSDDVCNAKDEPPQLLSPIPAFLPTPDTLRRVPVLPRTTQNWLFPYPSHPAVCRSNNLLMNWRPSYLSPPAVRPDPPFQMGAVERRAPGFGVEAHMEREFMGLSSSAPAGLSHFGVQFSSEGR